GRLGVRGDDPVVPGRLAVVLQQGRGSRPRPRLPRVRILVPHGAERRDSVMAVLEAYRVTKTYHDRSEPVSVLRGASLSVDRGEIVALEGPSGSGKTTLLTILGCLLTPSSGRLVIDGRTVDPGRPQELPEFRRKSIGFVFQQFNLFPALTAVEN